MRLRLSSLVVRQTLLTVLVVLAAVSAFAFAAISTVHDGARAGLLRTVDTDIAGLVDIAANGGAPDLRRRIADRIALQPLADAAPYYWLADANGRRIAGNLAAMPNVDAAHSEASDVRIAGDDLIVRATKLHGNLTLVVGRSLAPVEALTARLWRSFTWAALATLAMALLVAALAAMRLGARVERLNHTFDRFDRGDLTARAGPAAGGDEVAQLAAHVDGHLATIEALLHAQRQISDNIAHELRTPLVHLDSRLLRAIEGNRDPDVAEQLDRARADIRSVVSLFDALLDIAMAESTGEGTPAPVVDLSEFAGDVAELYAASAEEAGISFSTRIAPEVTLRGEAMQLTRLIANLLDNAFKYAPSGSRVRLVVAQGPRIVVEDNGPGVAPEDRERIFQRFLRSAPSSNGHGLGLALVKVIAARHGMTARVEDAAPGARFVIEPLGAV